MEAGKSSGVRLLRARSGSVSTLFAMTVLPVTLSIALAIDYTRVVAARANLQNSADFASLALAKSIAPTTTAASLTAPAVSLLRTASMKQPATLIGGVTLAGNNTEVCLTASSNVPATFVSFVSNSLANVTTRSCATVQGGGTYEIALVLDNTGSMSESAGGKSKIESAKSAALSLISQLNPPGKTPAATFSVVPFSTSVNVGANYAGAAWLDQNGQSSIHWQNYQRPAGASWLPASRFELFAQMGATWAGCVEERPDPYLVTDTPASAGDPNSLFVPYLWPDEGDVNGDGSAQLPGVSNSNGNGRGSSRIYTAANWDLGAAQNNYLYDFGGACTADATDPYVAADVLDPVSRGAGATKLCKYKGATGVSSSTSRSGPNHGCMANPLMTMTQDTAALTAKINSMTAGGTTNLLPGFMWGWRTISPNGPFAGANGPKPYGAPGNAKIIVFMTDGFNNWSQNSSYAYKSEYNGFGYYVNNRLSAYGGATFPPATGASNYDGPTTSNSWRMQMDAALLAACTNAKNAGVIVYTIGFSVPSDPIDNEGLQLLAKCASSPDRSYVARDASSIVSVYNQIGVGLGNLRLIR